MVNIAVWGLGSHAVRNTLPALQLSREHNLVGVYTRNQETREKIASDYGISQWNSAEALLNDKGIDAVYIATPVGVHFTQVKAALESGKHVYCEKTLVTTQQQNQCLFDMSERADLLLAECIMYFYHPQFATVKALLAAGEIGDIHSVYARFGYPHLSQNNIRYQKPLGGGALLDAGVYPLSMLVELAHANVDSFTGHLAYSPDYSVDVRGACLARYGDVCFHGEWGMGRDYANEVEFWGSEGKLIVPRTFSKSPQLETTLCLTKNGKKEEIKVAPDNHFIRMFDKFAQLTKDKKQRIWMQQRSLKMSELMNILFMQDKVL